MIHQRLSGVSAVMIMALCAVLVMVMLATQTNGTPFDVRAMHGLNRVGTPAVDPKGQLAVYTVKQWNEKTNKASTWLEVLFLNSTTDPMRTAPLTKPTESVSDYNPVFSADGNSLLFLSNREKGHGVQIYGMSMRGAQEPRRLTQFPSNVGIDNLKVSSKFVIFTMEVYNECKGDLECTAKKNDDFESRGWMEYDQLFARHWDRWETGKVSHIFMLEMSKLGDFNARPRDLMAGMDVNSPVAPFGGSEQIAISPNGDEIAFCGEVVAHDRAWSTAWKILTVSTAAGSKPEFVTFIDARTQDPQYSPDGKYLSYLAMDRPLLESDRLHVELIERASKKRTSLTASWDRSVAGYTWTRDSKYILATADDDGAHKVFSIDATNGSVNELISTGSNHGIVQGQNNKFYFARDTLKSPAEIFSFEFSAGKLIYPAPAQLTFYNRQKMREISFSEYEKFYFDGVDGEVQGWIVKPYNFDPSKKYPLAYLIHGGPEGMWSDGWSFRWNPQLWAGHGYVTVMVNPPGSTGFGQAFTDAVRGDWGGKPYKDLMIGVDHVIAKYNFIDGSKITACGASYGGFMINWINAMQNKSGKFKALVSHDGVFNQVAMYYSTEELWFTEAENEGLPWVNRNNFEKFSPVNYVHQMHTPTLIIHGSKDYRIPEAEGLGMFTALQRRGIPSKLLIFPEENHWVLAPTHSIKWYDTVLGWLDQHTA